MTAFGLQLYSDRWGLIVHGGISRADSTKPRNQFFITPKITDGSDYTYGISLRYTPSHVRKDKTRYYKTVFVEVPVMKAKRCALL